MQLLAEQTFEHAKKGKFCVTLGGDHSLGIGSLGGILSARPDTGVIWVVCSLIHSLVF